ncbi:At-rich interactive domain-containing protein [Thalictrum thalictroides]|uniref:At-rich interactive domain-containing protein n=1 Tax=Thalictrum thalictroides TaxID=46969 RepID=A0A7J6V566_THATH|nr:At-rich interactive domain-containing protein [Thalictrum thalictroides]
MAGWSILGNGSAFDYFEILQHLQKNGFYLDFDLNSLKMSNDGGVVGGGSGKDNKLRDMFDQILSVFMKEISVRENILPLPVLLGDGQSVDLFKLFWVVREKGGFDLVSKFGRWGSVADEIGLESGVASSLKLFYFKYLDALDRWLQTVLRDKGISIGECDRNLGLLPVGLKSQLKDFLCNISAQGRISEEQRKNNKVLSSKGAHNLAELASVEKCIVDDDEEVAIYPTELGSVEKCVVDDDKDVVILDKNVVKEEVYFRKRKRETLSGMLNWVKEIAKNPSDAAIAKLAEIYKQNGYGVKELLGMVLLARDALFQSQICWTEEKENPIWQKKQKMHPSLYEDEVDVDHLSMERQRCSPRILSQRNCQMDPHHDSSYLDISASSPEEIDSDQSANPDDGDVRFPKPVPVGPLSQADIPEWTGVATESDPKWLGTRVWPLMTGEQSSLTETISIGKGRQDSCFCRLPGSVDCVRFHIAENRMKLNSELGVVFYTWRFHLMGEEVSLSWTEDEENKFKSIVRLNPFSQEKSFWNQLCRCFRTKSWKSLVNYYFNVFVLRRRTYQNRVTPSNIDSDDDELEFGSLSNGYGHESVKLAASTSITCVQNTQCTNLE